MNNLLRLTIFILITLSLSGCKDPEAVSATEFQAMLERNPESMRQTEFMGVKDGKALLKVSTMSSYNQKKWTDEFYSTDASKLPNDWLEQQENQKSEP